MKKIIIISVLSLVLISCNGEIKNDKIEKTEKNVSVENKKNIQEEIAGDVLDPLVGNNEIKIEDLEKNISKLKGINFNKEDLRMLNEQVISMFNNYITNDAIEKLDINICDKLEANYSDNCKMQVLRKIGNVDKCSIFSNTGSFNNCKREIYFSKSLEKVDETICEKIEDNSQEKFEVNNCKNRVFEKKAIKNLDSSICKNIGEKMQVEMCVEMVKMEKENKKMLDSMKKQEEELKKQEEQRKIEEEKNTGSGANL